jgi:hypothetical protein
MDCSKCVDDDKFSKHGKPSQIGILVELINIGLASLGCFGNECCSINGVSLILIVWIIQGVDNGKFNKLGELSQPI